MSPHLPRHQLEELAVREDAVLRAHVDACEACSARLQALLSARASFVQARDQHAFARTVISRRKSRRRPTHWLWAATLAAAAALLVIWMRDDPTVRYKGGTLFQVFVQRDGSPQSLANGQRLAAGDQLAFAYSLTEPRYLLLLSIDDTGTITKYYPLDARPASPLGPTRPRPLPVGIELDGHRGEERLVALFSRTPLDEARVQNALRKALHDAQARRLGVGEMGPLMLPAEQTSVWFRKP